ncbi:F-box domain-containing protein [Raphanus sativus]|nr:F-box domain-containing protein [Raphanus sativus]
MNRKVRQRVDEDGEDMSSSQRVDEDGEDMSSRVCQRVDEEDKDMNHRVVRQRVDEDGKDKVGSPSYLLTGDEVIAPKIQESMDMTSLTYDVMFHVFTLLDNRDRASLASTCDCGCSLLDILLRVLH